MHNYNKKNLVRLIVLCVTYPRAAAQTNSLHAVRNLKCQYLQYVKQESDVFNI